MQGHTLNLITIHCALGLWLLPSLARTYIGGGQALQVSDYIQQLLYQPLISMQEERFLTINTATSETYTDLRAS